MNDPVTLAPRTRLIRFAEIRRRYGWNYKYVMKLEACGLLHPVRNGTGYRWYSEAEVESLTRPASSIEHPVSSIQHPASSIHA